MNRITKKNTEAWNKIYQDLESQIVQYIDKDIEAINDKHEEYIKKIEAAKKMLAEQQSAPVTYYSAGGYVPAPSQPMKRSGQSLVSRHAKAFAKDASCPECDHPCNISTAIQHLNDFHEWSREAIADWLDTLDEQPIFYPDTCPDDCTCEMCNPPQPTVYDMSGITVSKLTAGTISSKMLVGHSSLSISDYLPQIHASTKEISYAFQSIADEISKMWQNQILVEFTNKSSYVPEQISADAFSYSVKSYNDCWKASFEISGSALKQLTLEQRKNIEKLIYTGGEYQSFYTHEKVTYTLNFEGSQKYILGISNHMKEYLNVPGKSCHCTGSKYQPGEHCPKHSASKSPYGK